MVLTGEREPGKGIGTMKILLVLLPCMLATLQWYSCEASRKIVLEKTEAEGSVALPVVPKTRLFEAVDEGNGVETEFMLPDEGDNEKPEIIIEEEKKASKKQEDLITEAFEEQSFEETKQRKDPEEESSLSGIGEGDLMLEESKDETWVGDEPKKKEENYKTKEASTDKSKAKKKKAVIDQKVAGQLTEDNTPANADKGEAVEGFTGGASLPNTETETSKGDFLLESAEEEDGTTSIRKEMQREDVQVKRKSKKIEERSNLKVEKLDKEGSKKKSSDDDILKAKKDGVKEPAIEKGGKMGGSFERFKKKRSDNKDMTGEAMAEETADEETPADLSEREMHGGVQDSETSASKTRKIEEEKHENTEIHIHANENGGKDKQTPTKEIKTPKKPNLEALEEADFEPTGSEANEKKIKMKVKKKDSQPESEKGSVRTSAKNKEVNKEDKAKSQFKKKKVKFDKLKKEENSDVKEEDEEVFSDKAVQKFPKTSTTPQEEGEKSFRKVEIKEKNPISDDKTKKGSEHSKFADGSSGEDTHNLKILEVVDDKIDEAEKDLSTGEDYPDNKHVKSSQEELPDTQKQEGKLDLRVQGIAEEAARERAEGSTSLTKSVASIELADEEDDEYSDFMQDFSDLSTKFQDTAHKVADHLGPNIQKLTDTSKTYFNKANQQITESFSPLVGKQFAPFFSSLVSYGLLLIPLAVVIVLFEHIRAMLSLQKVLLFVNIYLAAYFATLLLATFIMGEPMTFFYRSSASGYVHLQLLQALGYIIYLTLQTIDLVSSCSSEACSIKVSVVLQWFVAATIGFHYYVTIFHRAMTLKSPHTNWKIYGIYSCAFLVLCLFARVKRVKKGYVQIGQADTDKKH